jgi:uncharacterized protein
MKRRTKAIGVAALGGVLAAWSAVGARAAETLPPSPQSYFNDYAGVISSSDARRIDDKLRRFDEESSNQVLVVVFPELPSASMEDFTARTAQSWRVGRKKLDNGVVLFVFVKDRRMRLEVGYGLEGALPDATANRIIQDTISPQLRSGRYAAGLEAGVDGIIAATRGEYRAPPRRARGRTSRSPWVILFPIAFILLMGFLGRNRMGPRMTYGSRGYRRRGYWGGGPWMGGGFGGGFGGGSSGGSWGGGSSGGFSGGGGSFGGGGASGSW